MAWRGVDAWRSPDGIASACRNFVSADEARLAGRLPLRTASALRDFLEGVGKLSSQVVVEPVAGTLGHLLEGTRLFEQVRSPIGTRIAVGAIGHASMARGIVAPQRRFPHSAF